MPRTTFVTAILYVVVVVVVEATVTITSCNCYRCRNIVIFDVVFVVVVLKATWLLKCLPLPLCNAI